MASSSYYARQQLRGQPTLAWERAVVCAIKRYSRSYGTRRPRAEEYAEGHRVGSWRIGRVMAAHGLRVM